LQFCLAAYGERPADATVWADLQTARHAAAAAIAGLNPKQKEDETLAAVRVLLQAVAASGAFDEPVGREDLALAASHTREKSWPGLLAAMLLVPAWQWPAAPDFAAVPRWLWADYVAYVFHTPQGFCSAGQTETYAAHYLRRLEEFVRLAGPARGDAPVRASLLEYLQVANSIPLYFSCGSLRRYAELRGRLLSLFFTSQPAKPLRPRPRTGRRLRVGFVNRHFGPQTETYTTLPNFEQLDPARFEVHLFAHAQGDTPLEAYCRSRAAAFHLLPADLAAQVAQLRAAALDVVVFGTNVTAVVNEVTQLALHRLAPLQVVNNSSCITSGFPEIDLYVSGDLTEMAGAQEHFTERLGLLPGPAHAFNYNADQQEPSLTFTREALGIPEHALVFVSAANYFKIIPEMRELWARQLAAVPGSCLLLHPFNPNWSSHYPVRRFRAEMERMLAAHGVAASRLVLSTARFPSRADVKTLLALGDIYLDTYPFGGVNSLVDPLELGLPVVVWEGETMRSRMGAALLRQLNLGELIATDEAGYTAIIGRLATDPAVRAELSARINAEMSSLPLFLDSQAASDAFGALLETGYDEMQAGGPAAFRRPRPPLRVPAAPDAGEKLRTGLAEFKAGRFARAADCARAVLGAEPARPEARHLLGRVLLRTGLPARAADYFLAAIQHSVPSAALWLDLAEAYHGSKRPGEAAQALEASLKLNPDCRAAWLLFSEFAFAAGNRELGEQAFATARELGGLARPAACEHILVFTDDPAHGGVAQYNHTLLVALAAAGHRVTCVQSASASPLTREQRASGIRHVWLDYDTGREFSRTVEDVSSAAWIFTAERPDLIVFSDCSPVSNLAAREVAMQQGIPFIVVVGFVAPYLATNFASRLGQLAAHYAAAREVVAVSRENLALLRRHFGLAADRGRVIHYGRPDRFFAPRDAEVRARLREAAGIPADAVVCFTAARLTEVKGFNHQLQAAQTLCASPAGRKIHFVWAGEGEQRADLERKIARLGLAGSVHLLGQRWDVADWHDAADIFVLPSQLEGMPLAIMEAMAKGLPVVATAVSGIPEELGDTGKLLPDPATDPAGVVNGLMVTIATWAADPAEREREGARCRARAEKLFREDRMMAETFALFNGQQPAPAFQAANCLSGKGCPNQPHLTHHELS
jgi:glycosyltransferase involved in cell wall biosynthesis